uniref:Small ribosomal subunit protein uS3m n=1 Tax=Ramalina intermedia TaxID=86788 RepID=A0A5B8H2W2_9LECA|nr:ribosomal protein S3 [Ramalina intermedia]QDX14924.1 ribosomal protein S3 [Ramalina intermedia]
MKNKTKPTHAITESNYAGKIKHYPPANKEWSGSIYAYNNNNTKLSPYSDKLVSKLVRGYFNSYSRVLEGNIIKKRSRRYRLIRARLSANRILVSRAEVKHTNDKALITVYIYNNDYRYYKNKLDNIVLYNNNNIFKSIKQAELKLKPKLQYNRSNLYSLLYNKTFAVGGKSLESRFNMYEKKYIRDFFHKFLRKEIVSIYYKQLIRFNKLKFEKQYVSSLSDEIRKIYNKNVEFNFVNLRYLYLNSSVFSSALVIKIRNRRNKLLTALQNSLQMFDLPDINRQAVYNQIYNKNTVIQNLDLKSARTSLYNELTKVIGSMRNKSVSGVRIEIAGRLTKRNTAARAISKLRYKGNIKDMDSSNKGLSTVMMRGNVKSNLQYTKLKSKWRIGSFGLKGWVSSS